MHAWWTLCANPEGCRADVEMVQIVGNRNEVIDPNMYDGDWNKKLTYKGARIGYYPCVGNV